MLYIFFKGFLRINTTIFFLFSVKTEMAKVFLLKDLHMVSYFHY